MMSALRGVGVATHWAGNFPGLWEAGRRARRTHGLTAGAPLTETANATRAALGGGQWHGVPLLPC